MERNFKAGDKVEWSTDDADFAGEVVATVDEIWVYVQTPTQPGKILMVPWFKVNPALSPVQIPNPPEYTEIMETVDYTTITTYDSCHDLAPCRVFHDALAVPVTTQCRHCEPEAYEAIARVEIDWFLRPRR